MKNAEIRNCQFKFECPKLWSSLDKTSQPKIRHCKQCNQDVHYCQTAKELQTAVIKNYCVAVEVTHQKSNKPEILMGDVISFNR
jgi:hypothetical protein